MTCQYCRAQNSEDDHRCSRCGRRLHDDGSTVRPYPVQMTAAAPKLQPSPSPPAQQEQPRNRPQLVETPARPSAVPGRAVQPSLFGPLPVARTSELPSRRSDTGSKRRSEPAFFQESFDFSSTTDGARTLPTSVEANVYCDAPVAASVQRLTAAAIDLMIPVVGLGTFLTAAQLTVSELQFDGRTAPWFAAAGLLLVLFYRLICCLGNMDTIGMQWAGLRLLDFDGRQPKRKARAWRIAGGIVGALAGGLGLLWSLFDEEHLTWHDLMSGTFPTTRAR